MTSLKKGSKGKTVAQLQQRLRELGFDAEGSFGPASEAAVIDFQEKYGLLPDGIVGPSTRRALDSPPPFGDPSRPPFEVDRSLRLSPGQFIDEAHPKDLIVLHHTAGGSAVSTVRWWNSGDHRRIATAYIVERDGVVSEVFDPRLWAFHLGIAGTGGRVDRRSIGIEIASEGGLKIKDGEFYKFDKVGAGHEFHGSIYDHGSSWRGYRYFAAYTDAQESAVADLVDHLCASSGIARRTPADPSLFSADHVEFRGVISHSHVRPDKSDIHPGFSWQALADKCLLSLD